MTKLLLLAAALLAAAPLPRPLPPPGPPPNQALVQLGRHLFYDQRLSVNGTTSCATCHRQELAFTDGRAMAQGATGQSHPRGSMSLVNLAYNSAFNWADPTVHSLEEQALKPLLSTHPVELGFGSVQASFLRLLRTDPTYRPLVLRAFPGDTHPFTLAHLTRALAAFERTLLSANSPYDRFHYEGDEAAISASAKRGEILFFLDGGPSCFRCHGGFNFSDTTASVAGRPSPVFHNTGLYNLINGPSYPAPNRGLYEHTRRPSDMGKFRAPTLRNIAVTAPYMHDGSVATLEEVIDHYAAGGRTISTGSLAGNGRLHPAKDPLVRGFPLTPQNRADLVAFLRSLTDEDFLQNPRFANPWPTSRTSR